MNKTPTWIRTAWSIGLCGSFLRPCSVVELSFSEAKLVRRQRIRYAQVRVQWLVEDVLLESDQIAVGQLHDRILFGVR